jgi:hypothetical protein
MNKRIGFLFPARTVRPHLDWVSGNKINTVIEQTAPPSLPAAPYPKRPVSNTKLEGEIQDNCIQLILKEGGQFIRLTFLQRFKSYSVLYEIVGLMSRFTRILESAKMPAKSRWKCARLSMPIIALAGVSSAAFQKRSANGTNGNPGR